MAKFLGDTFFDHMLEKYTMLKFGKVWHLSTRKWSMPRDLDNLFFAWQSYIRNGSPQCHRRVQGGMIFCITWIIWDSMNDLLICEEVQVDLC